VKRNLRVLALAAVLGLVAAACGGGGNETPGNQTGASGASGAALQQGGTVQAALISDIDAGFDPQKSYYSVTWEFYQCCLLRTLLSYNGKTTAEGGADLQPDIAVDQPEVSADGLTWTFTLKSGIKYGDPLSDVEVTSGDIVRALEREADPNASVGGYSFYYSIIQGFDDFGAGKADSITGLETPDDKTLVVTLTQPSGYLPYLFSLVASAPIPPNPSNPDAKLGIADGHTKDFGRFFVATGPYEFAGSDQLDFSVPADQQTPVSGYEPGKSIQMVRNPSWDPSTDDLRPAYPDAIDVTIGGEENDLANKVLSGELDIVIDGAAPPQILRQYSTDPSLQSLLHINPSDVTRYLSFNIAEPPFDDIHVRKAVNLAIDKEGMRTLRGGESVGEIAGHIMVDSLENNLLKDYDPYATPNSSGDLDAAKAEMAQSKYDTNQDGVCDAPECSNILSVTDEAAPYPAQSALIKQNLEPLGLTLNVTSFERTTMYAKCNDPSAHVAFCMGPAWGKDFPDGVTFATPLFDSVSIYPSCCNYALVGASTDLLKKYKYATSPAIPSVDDQITAANATTGADRFQAWADLDTKLMEDVVPWVPYLFDNSVDVTSARIVNYSFDQFAGVAALDQFAIDPSAQ
jgi:peptide/nickel transport system substrate-binding protein